ncbi:hypothetical protein DCAR_0206794 [Daucus carota subsp. sativus]|uniref:AB hydrolase-1 domain-containing protein n=1 Tax=Daucus carota subsp. sativus TaxID=79200 RepID=A0AAF0WGC4_DAUCS|nr:PREDICTED: uncharacterized protein LOC108210079 [Daucus carota subsp. sativus]WOG87565.1 hypothetical protein DCAR_0206794 [Daucus carota subsp. sativus]
MSQTTPWRDDPTSFVTDGVRIGVAAAPPAMPTVPPAVPYGGGVDRNWKFHAVEFWRGFAEMSVEFGKGVRDVMKQSVMRDDSFLVKNFGPPVRKVRKELKFLNEYLPEDRDPVHSWSVIFVVLFFVIAALYVNTECDATSPLVKKLYIQPANATRILLPDGRHLAYQEQGVPAASSRFSIIAPHSFLSSRLAGIPGIKISLLQEFGVRLITYDLPGFGESDPHPNRDLKSSADDVLYLSYAVGVTDKFWVLGYSGGSLHAWATLRYIPDRVAGAFMVSPMINPYEPSMSKEEKKRTWSRWTLQKKFMYFLARRFPRFLPYFYHHGFLSGSVGQINKWLSLSLGKRDRDFIEDERFAEFWLRDVAESVRQGNVKPFVEEAVLQVSSWGFRLSELKVQKKRKGRGIIFWITSKYSRVEEELIGFLGPIHIWQGMEDRVVPPSMTDFTQRVLPGVMVHKLLNHGHFTYFYFCNECHRQIFTTLFGNPQGPVANNDHTLIERDNEDTEDVTLGDSPQVETDL